MTSIEEVLTLCKQVSRAPDTLLRTVDALRAEMESPAIHFRTGAGTGGAAVGGARGGGAGASQRGNGFQQPTRSFGIRDGGVGGASGGTDGWKTVGHSSGANTNTNAFGQSTTKQGGIPPPSTRTKYQSHFQSKGNLDEKILNTVIGNKLNAFTTVTYNDTRDFIYQIMDSGETEFICDFVEKVFSKATLEDLYCALFAKLIAELAQKYPSIYEEMRKYHSKFLAVFDDVDNSRTSSLEEQVKKRQYRIGYGQFLAELAGKNALEKGQLTAMVSKVMEKIMELSALPDKTKAVEECIDCLVRSMKSLRACSESFFRSVREELRTTVWENASMLIEKRAGERPSFSTKARFGMMDFRDLVADA